MPDIPATIPSLIERFERNIDSYRSPAYKEAHVRNEFVNRPLKRSVGMTIELNAGRTPDEKTMLQRQIDATDRQIDTLVYESYGLTLRCFSGDIE